MQYASKTRAAIAKTAKACQGCIFARKCTHRDAWYPKYRIQSLPEYTKTVIGLLISFEVVPPAIIS